MFPYKYAQPNCHAIVDLKPRNIQYSMQTILANKILPFPTSKTVEYTEFSRKKNPPADFSTGGNKMYRGIFIPTRRVKSISKLFCIEDLIRRGFI